MLLLSRIRVTQPDRAICVGRVPLSSPLVDEHHRAPAILGVEMGAQCAGVLAASAETGEAAAPEPAVGYLVRIREAKMATAALPAGRDLEVEARRTAGAGRLGIYQIRVTNGPDGATLVTATVTTMATSRGSERGSPRSRPLKE